MGRDMETAVKAIILKKDGRILVLEQRVDGELFYSLPGGRMKEGTNEVDELKREVREETGLEISDAEYVGDWMFERKDGTKRLCKTYLGREFAGELTTAGKENYEELGPMWLLPDEFVTKCSNSKSLSDLLKGLRNEGKV